MKCCLMNGIQNILLLVRACGFSGPYALRISGYRGAGDGAGHVGHVVRLANFAVVGGALSVFCTAWPAGNGAKKDVGAIVILVGTALEDGVGVPPRNGVGVAERMLKDVTVELEETDVEVPTQFLPDARLPIGQDSDVNCVLALLEVKLTEDEDMVLGDLEDVDDKAEDAHEETVLKGLTSGKSVIQLELVDELAILNTEPLLEKDDDRLPDAPVEDEALPVVTTLELEADEEVVLLVELKHEPEVDEDAALVVEVDDAVLVVAIVKVEAEDEVTMLAGSRTSL